MHEIFHALGRWHEQSRPDRDLYIKIIEDNIQSGTHNQDCWMWNSLPTIYACFPSTGVESNFDVISSAFATTQGVSYDFFSIMHYSAYAFSRNGQPTIVPLDSSRSLNSLGQREGFSEGDLQHVKTLYCGECERETKQHTFSLPAPVSCSLFLTLTLPLFSFFPSSSLPLSSPFPFHFHSCQPKVASW